MATDQDIAQMPIQDAVKLPGGNGLASPAFQIPLNILLIYGWHNIEQGVEACVCDGVSIPKTQLRSEFMRLIGRKSFVRRVLLQPPPLEIVASGLTRDLLKLSLTIAIKYEVKKPVIVASLSDPLGELKNIIEGISSEFIRLHSLNYFISDEGEVRKQIQIKIQDTDTVKDTYLIYEVLKAIPSGDETLLEISRQTEAAKMQKDLIEAEGVNREEEAKHNLEIARKQADLDDEMARRKHEREKEIRELEAREEILKTAINALGQVAGAGVDPSKVTKDVIGTLAESIQHTHLATVSTPALPDSPDSQHVIDIEKKESTQLHKEKQGLESIKNKLEITTYDILETNSQITGAIVQMKEYEIIFRCGDNYPFEEPLATIRFPDGTTQTIEDYWIPGVSNSLAQAVLTISFQLRSDK